MAVVLFLLCCLLTLAPAGAAALDIHAVGFAASSWDISIAYDINSAGQAVGFHQSGGSSSGFLYSSKTVTDICPPGWTDCAAGSISENGNIGGYGYDGLDQKGFVRRGGSYETVAPSGWSSVRVVDANDSGQSTGYGTSGGAIWGFYHDSGAFSFFKPVTYTEMRGEAINSAGVIVGHGVTGGADKALRYQGGVLTDPAPPGWTNTRAVGINDSGDIIGEGDSGGLTRCYLNRGGSFVTILPPGWEESSCYDINGPGDIIGSGADPDGIVRSFVYRKGRYHFYEGPFIARSLSDQGMVAGAESASPFAAAAAVGYLLPEPVMTANGAGGLVETGRTTPPKLKGALAVFGFAGRPADWWVFAQTPAGPLTFDIAARRWVPGFRPAAVMPLRDVGGARLPPAGSAPGFYTYYLGTDLIANGRVDVKFLVFDSVTVFVR